jgi:hypothetical protein
MAITINGSGTVTGLSVGGLPDGTVDSGTLATDSVTAVKIPDTVESSLKSGRKNLIINGGMQVWQRGTSFSGLTSYTYQVDRFQCANSTACSRSADVPTGEGFLYSAKYTAIANDNFIRGMLEDTHRLLGSNTFTFSFWVKGSVAATGNIDVGDQQGQNFSITTSWTRVTKSFTAISTTAHGGTANDYFDIFTHTAGDMYITGIQLELGSVATDFEHRSYGEELALCQRYYEKSWNHDTALGTATGVGAPYSGIGGSSTSSYLGGTHAFRVRKRVNPSLVVYDTAGNVGKCTRDNFGVSNGTNQVCVITSSSESGFLVYSTGTYTAKTILYHFTADAEL